MDRVHRLDNENIIVVTNNVEITPEVVEENRAACRALIQEMDGPIVLVIDYRDAKTNFASIIKIMQGNRTGKRADLNQRTFTIMVGTNQLINMYRDSMRQEESGGVQIPYFSDMEDALETARIHLNNLNRENTA